MAFFNSAVGVLQTLVVALGAGLGIWGAINLLEGYATTTPVQMLMYVKEASNRKQEIDRQHHTIPNQRPKKHYGNTSYLSYLFINSYILFRVLHYHLQSVNMFIHPQSVEIKGEQNGTANF